MAPYMHIMRIRKILISYVKLDHTLYSINYGSSLRCMCGVCALAALEL